MNLTEYRNALKTANAAFRTTTPVSVQPQQAAWLNEIAQRLTWAGDNPALWDYPQGTVIANAVSTSTPSATFTFDRDLIARAHLVRVSATAGSTPTCTYAIQGSTDSSTWNNLLFADFLTPDTAVSTSFTLNSGFPVTAIKLIIPAQKFRYLRVNMTANTNVTNTIDVTPL